MMETQNFFMQTFFDVCLSITDNAKLAVLRFPSAVAENTRELFGRRRLGTLSNQVAGFFVNFVAAPLVLF